MSKQSRKPGQRGRLGKNSFTTRSGNNIKLNRSITGRIKARKDQRSRKRAANLSTLPKGRVKRFFAHFEPKRMYHYWFSREGGIMALKLVGIGVVAGFLLLVGLFAYFRKDLPDLKDISGNNLGGSISYYDRTGTTLLWQDYDAVKRIPVKDEAIAPYMKQATVAVEDKDFFKHGGFDVRGIARAGINDALKTGSTQGGSTITQQVVKLNENWTNDRTITRKIKELILAVELERNYTKKDILTGYLNIAPYGGVEYGAQSAAQDYFQVDANQLTLAQAAMLASIPKAPTAYSPYSSPNYNPSATANLFDANGLIQRQHYILDLMVQQRYVTKAQAEDAKKVDILAQVHPMQSRYNGIKAPYFVLATKQELDNKYGAATVKRGGWKVITTLDMNLQTAAENLVAKNVSNISRLTRGVADEEAIVGEDVQTGQIVSLVGGTDFNNADHGKINYAAQALIPPGSSFKPYDYTTLIDNNNSVGAGSVLYDTQTPLPGYPCTNKGLPPPKGQGNCLEDYDFIYPGPLTLRYALGGSRNVPAVKAMLSAVPNDASTGKVNSINKVISTAQAMMANPYNPKTYNCYNQGVDVNNASTADQTQCYGASAIGDGAFLHLDDHVNGLSTLARLGSAIPRTYILQITDSANKTVTKWTQPKGKQVIKPDSAYIVNNMASDPNASYLPGSCSATTCTALARGGYKFQRTNGWDFAVKTGTTNNGFDGLMTSWSTKYAVVTWVGNHTRNKELNSSMEYLTEPLARGWMEAAHSGITPVNWTPPAGIKTLPAFVVRNHIHYGDIEPSPTNDLFPSWYQAKSTSNTSQSTDKVSGLLATSCTPDSAKQTQANANASSWNVDIFAGGSTSIGSSSSGTATASANDNIHNCSDVKPTVSISAPSTCDAKSGGCIISAQVAAGTHPLTDPARTQFPGTITFNINGAQANTQSVSGPGTYTFTYTPTAEGNFTVTATVTDSVLYSATDSATVTGSIAIAPSQTRTNLRLSAAPATNSSGGGNSGNSRRLFRLVF